MGNSGRFRYMSSSNSVVDRRDLPFEHQPDIFSDIECTWACELKSTAKHGKVRQSTAKRRAIMNGAGTAPCNDERRRNSTQPLYYNILLYLGCRSQRQVNGRCFQAGEQKIITSSDDKLGCCQTVDFICNPTNHPSHPLLLSGGWLSCLR